MPGPMGRAGSRKSLRGACGARNDAPTQAGRPQSRPNAASGARVRAVGGQAALAASSFSLAAIHSSSSRFTRAR